MSAQIISSINMKGGVGKTSLTINLAASLVRFHGKRVLVVDLDPQTNATFSLVEFAAWDKWAQSNPTLAELMQQNEEYNLIGKEEKTENAIIKNVGNIDNLDLIPSHLKLTFIDIQLASSPARERILKRKLQEVSNDYDFIFCDCPPNLSICTQNALVASDYYIVPTLPEVLAALGLGLFNNRIKNLIQRMDMQIQSTGIIFTRYDKRTEETLKTANEIIAGNPHEYVFRTRIPENVCVRKAIRLASSVIVSSPNSSGARAYKELAVEFLARLNTMNTN